MSLLDVFLTVLVGVVAGAINTIAGGGSLITLPMLIFLGLPANVANGTNRVGVVLQSASAAVTFQRQRLLDAPLTLRLLAPTSAGAILGAWLSVDIDEDSFRAIIAVALVLILPVVLYKPHQRASEPAEGAPAPSTAGWTQPLLFFAVGLYGGFLQAGVGVFLLTAIVRSTGLDLVRGNAVKVALMTVFATLALSLFLFEGLVAWRYAAALAVGSVIGGWLGSKLTISWGPRLVQVVLVCTVLASASKLFGLW